MFSFVSFIIWCIIAFVGGIIVDLILDTIFGNKNNNK